MSKIVVGISGGIDSAVTAYRLKQEGYEVIGAHLQVTENPIVDPEKIERIKNALEIPIHILHVEEKFKRIVLKNFKEDHLAGRTPSPCIVCNPELKWQALYELAEQVEAEYIASGHYINKEKINDTWYLLKGIDAVKDQSYFLWRLTQPQLNKMHTPLGEISKNEVIAYAKETNLHFLAEQKESTGLCFAQGLSYPELLEQYIPEIKTLGTGEVWNSDNEVVGSHKGYVYYTIGQKRGIYFFDDAHKGLCIVKLDAENNRIYVDNEDSLWVNSFFINQCDFVNEQEVLRHKQLTVMVRGIGRNPAGYGQVSIMHDGMYQVELENPAWAMAPGQPVVFYHENRLLGGGIMCSPCSDSDTSA